MKKQHFQKELVACGMHPNRKRISMFSRLNQREDKRRKRNRSDLDNEALRFVFSASTIFLLHRRENKNLYESTRGGVGGGTRQLDLSNPSVDDKKERKKKEKEPPPS